MKVSLFIAAFGFFSQFLGASAIYDPDAAAAKSKPSDTTSERSSLRGLGGLFDDKGKGTAEDNDDGTATYIVKFVDNIGNGKDKAQGLAKAFGGTVGHVYEKGESCQGDIHSLPVYLLHIFSHNIILSCFKLQSTMVSL